MFRNTRHVVDQLTQMFIYFKYPLTLGSKLDSGPGC